MLFCVCIYIAVVLVCVSILCNYTVIVPDSVRNCKNITLCIFYAYIHTGTDPWGHSLKLLMAAVMVGGGFVMSLMAYMQSKVLYNILYYVHSGIVYIITYLLYYV